MHFAHFLSLKVSREAISDALKFGLGAIAKLKPDFFFVSLAHKTSDEDKTIFPCAYREQFKRPSQIGHCGGFVHVLVLAFSR